MLALALLGLVAGLGQALAKFSLDATIQRDVPHRVQASAFARSDTTLQLAWVIGGFVGIAMPIDPPRLGLGVAVAALAAWGGFVLSRHPRFRGRAVADGELSCPLGYSSSSSASARSSLAVGRAVFASGCRPWR